MSANSYSRLIPSHGCVAINHDLVGHRETYVSHDWTRQAHLVNKCFMSCRVTTILPNRVHTAKLTEHFFLSQSIEIQDRDSHGWHLDISQTPRFLWQEEIWWQAQDHPLRNHEVSITTRHVSGESCFICDH